LIVTSVRLRILCTARRVKAVGSVVLDNCFQVEHIHVVEHDDGHLIVAMPSKYEDGRYHDVAHPITPQFRETMNRAVLTEYRKKAGPVNGAASDSVLTNPPGSVTVSQ
jgi:stage V sporulation protein G